MIYSGHQVHQIASAKILFLAYANTLQGHALFFLLASLLVIYKLLAWIIFQSRFKPFIVSTTF